MVSSKGGGGGKQQILGTISGPTAIVRAVAYLINIPLTNFPPETDQQNFEEAVMGWSEFNKRYKRGNSSSVRTHPPHPLRPL